MLYDLFPEYREKVDEVAKKIVSDLTEEEKTKFMKMNYEHFGVGLWIRIKYIYPANYETNADDMSLVVFNKVKELLNSSK